MRSDVETFRVTSNDATLAADMTQGCSGRTCRLTCLNHCLKVAAPLHVPPPAVRRLHGQHQAGCNGKGRHVEPMLPAAAAAAVPRGSNTLPLHWSRSGAAE